MAPESLTAADLLAGAGIEILSPHYRSIRDGDARTISAGPGESERPTSKP